MHFNAWHFAKRNRFYESSKALTWGFRVLRRKMLLMTTYKIIALAYHIYTLAIFCEIRQFEVIELFWALPGLMPFIVNHNTRPIYFHIFKENSANLLIWRNILWNFQVETFLKKFSNFQYYSTISLRKNRVCNFGIIFKANNLQ